MRKHPINLLLSLCVVVWLLSQPALAKEIVTLKQSKTGWHLLVNGEPYFIKGVTWSYTPVGHKYDFDLWGKDDTYIKAVLERDLSLMQAAGINTVRAMVPPKWVSYIYRTYGIRTIINEFCGRYGLTINGNYTFKTNYADPAVRAHIKATWRKLVDEYKGVEGVLMFALGNENNYGLEWQGAEIQNLPVGERHKAKATYLYTLFGELATQVKAQDPNHPVGIVNGEIQYLDLINAHCKDMDYLGVNVYRGKTFGPLFNDVKEKLGKPVMFMETGIDAYNAKDKREDHVSQAEFYFYNWFDIYTHAAGNGGADNMVGAVVFQWADEWWKQGQQVRLKEQALDGAWEHGAYFRDAAPGLKNMNEEWFGMCAISTAEQNGCHMIFPRVAYYMLRELFKTSPIGLGATKTKAHFENYADALARAHAARKAADVAGAIERAKASSKHQRDSRLRPGKAVTLPFRVYDDYSETMQFSASGHMGNTAAIAMDLKHAQGAQAGKTCIKISYTDKGQWAGVLWQDPAGDWGDKYGGVDLRAAKTLTVWAKGEVGGERLKFGFGLLDKKATFYDTAKGEREIVLTTQWKAYSIDVTALNLSRIKTPFSWVVAGQGKPITFYLDSIEYK